jgi:large subunit ribosomal protein L22
MPFIAKLNYLNIAPRKVRLVADLIRGKTVKEAQTILGLIPQKSALPLLKLLRSSISNVKNNLGVEESNLYILKITVDEGPKSKRWMPRARGQPSTIEKKTSHITLILEEIEPGQGKVKSETKEKVAEKPSKKISKPKFRKTEARARKPKIEKAPRRLFSRKAI